MIKDVIDKMIKYFGNDVRRINHALKVYTFARNIALMESIAGEELLIIEAAAVLHDIGIKESERKYNSSAGNYQEIEGPPIAEKMLKELNFENSTIDRICFLIGHHHTYGKIDKIDYQILIEADFIINIFEDNIGEIQVKEIKNKYFKTKAAIDYLESMYL